MSSLSSLLKWFDNITWKNNIVYFFSGIITSFFFMFFRRDITKWILEKTLNTEEWGVIIALGTIVLTIIQFAEQINKYNNDRESSKLALIRSSLITTQSKLQNLETDFRDYLDYLQAEIVLPTSQELSKHFIKIKSEHDVNELLKDSKRIKLLNLLLIQAYDKSKTRTRIINDLKELQNRLFTYQSDLPLLIGIINYCLLLLSELMYKFTTIPIIEPVLNDIKSHKKYDTSHIEQIITLRLIDEIKHSLKENLLPFLHSTKGVIDILANLVIQTNNQKLLKLMGWDARIFYAKSKKEDPMFELVENWMAFKKIKDKYPNLKFKLGCIHMRRMLNYLYELMEEPERLEKIIDKYPEDITLSVGTSERDNVLTRKRFLKITVWEKP